MTDRSGPKRTATAENPGIGSGLAIMVLSLVVMLYVDHSYTSYVAETSVRAEGYADPRSFDFMASQPRAGADTGAADRARPALARRARCTPAQTPGSAALDASQPRAASPGCPDPGS